MIDIKKTLSNLKIKDINNGSSTGSKSYGQGEIIKSYSPVDGKLIGGVTTTTKEEYEKIMQSTTNAFKDWRLKPAHFDCCFLMYFFKISGSKYLPIILNK